MINQDQNQELTQKNKDVFHYYPPIPLKTRLAFVEQKIRKIRIPKLQKEAIKYFKRLKRYYKKARYTGEKDCKFFYYFPELNRRHHIYGCTLWCQSQDTSLCEICCYSESNKDEPFDDFFRSQIEDFNSHTAKAVFKRIVNSLYDQILTAIEEDWERIASIHHNLKNLKSKRINILFLKILQRYFQRKYLQIKGSYEGYYILIL